VILSDPQLEDLTNPAVTTFLKTRRSYERINDDKNASLPPSKSIPKTPLKTTIAPHVLRIICRHHVKLNEDDLADEDLLAFVQRYANISLKGEGWPTSREALAYSLDTEIRDDYKLFDWLKK
jgi:hypothetical protein